MFQTKLTVALCTLVLLLALAACAVPATPAPAMPPPAPPPTAPTQAPAPTTAPTAAPAAAAKETVVVEAWYASLKSFNPWSTAQNEWRRMSKRVLGHLAWIDTKGQLVPDLAESWEVSKDSTKFTFHLRKGVTWHDGAPFTAADVKFTLETSAKKEYASGFLAGSKAIKGADDYANGKADSIAGLKMPDDYTIELELTAPSAALLYDLASNVNIVPRHIFKDVKPEDVTKTDYATKLPIGTGPWKVTRIVPDQTIEMVRYEKYWKAGHPNIDKYIYRIFGNYPASVAALLAGEVDIAEVQPADIDSVKRAANLNILSMPKGGVQLLYLNLASPVFKDVRVRQAIAYGMDRDGLAKGPFLGLATPLGQAFPPDWAWAQNPNAVKYDYNLDKAKSLLREAGYDTSQTLKFTTYYFSVEVDALQALLANMGIKVDVRKLDAPVWLQSFAKKDDWDIAYAAQFNRPDPAMTDGPFRCQPPNNNGYCNQKVHDLMVAAASTADKAERTRLYQEAHLLINQDLPYVPLVTADIAFGYNKRLTNFQYERIYWDYAEEWKMQ